jgi:hypothetical protein
LREDLQRRARRRAERYSLTAMADAYGELYASLAEGTHASRRASTAEARP